MPCNKKSGGKGLAPGGTLNSHCSLRGKFILYKSLRFPALTRIPKLHVVLYVQVQ